MYDKDKHLIFTYGVFRPFGAVGDFIYSLSFVKSMCERYKKKAIIKIGSYLKVKLDIEDLVDKLDFVDSVNYVQYTTLLKYKEDYDYCLEYIYTTDCGEGYIYTLEDILFKFYNEELSKDLWLDGIPTEKLIQEPYNVINVTPRYHVGLGFNWKDFLYNYNGLPLYFIGTPTEYQSIKNLDVTNRIVSHLPTRTVFDMYSYIKGCEEFYGNQSSCLALAYSMGKKAFVEYHYKGDFLRNPKYNQRFLN